MLLDSNILILYLNGDTSVINKLTAFYNSGRALFISVISITEVRSLSSLKRSELRKIDNFLDQFIALDVDQTIAKKASDLRRSQKLGFADAVIVATAFVHGLPLATRDQKLHKIASVQFVDL